VWAVVRLGHDKWTGPVRSGESGEVRVDLPGHNDLVHLPMDTEVALGLASTTLQDAVKLPGRLVGVERQARATRCSFVVADWDALTRRLPPLPRHTTDRRTSMRIEAHSDRAVEVPIHVLDGPRSARHLLAVIRDVGAGGLALWFPRGADERMCAVDTFVATMEWPGFPGLRDWRCQVRNRRLEDDGVRYGVQFLTEGGSQAEGPRFEPLWDCLFCGSEGLLAESHRHCPACGFARDDAPTRLPDWDDLVTYDSHPFTGTELTCRSCGVTHAGAAVYCVHCGSRL
jgi:hypothetical protein